MCWGGTVDAAVWGFIGTVVGAIVGAAASIVATTTASRSAAHLQRQGDVLERAERARAFQRDNLLAVQEALQDLARLSGRTYHADIMACRAGAEWGSQLLPSDLDEALGLANRRLSALEERVADDALRLELKETHRKFTDLAFAHSSEDAEALMSNAGESLAQAMAHLGDVLRSLY